MARPRSRSRWRASFARPRRWRSIHPRQPAGRPRHRGRRHRHRHGGAGVVTLVGLRNSVALLFRELGTDNIFAFHFSGEPYAAGTSVDVKRPAHPGFAPRCCALGPPSATDVDRLIVPVCHGTRAITARAAATSRTRCWWRAFSPNFYDVVGASSPGAPFTDYEERAARRSRYSAPASRARLFGPRSSVGQSFLLGGDRYYVVGEWRRGGAPSSARPHDTVVAIPVNTAA